MKYYVESFPLGADKVYFEVEEKVAKHLNKCDREIEVLNNVLRSYYIADKNLEEIIEYFQQDNFDFGSPLAFAEMNRNLLNFLNGFYAWVSYCEKNVKDDFPRLKVKFFESSFEYRLFYYLRNRQTHKGFCISGFSINLNTEKRQFIVNLDELIADNDINAKFRKELEKQKSKKLDLLPRLNDFKRLFTDMNAELIEAVLNHKVIIALKFLEETCPTTLGKHIPSIFLVTTTDDDIEMNREIINASSVTLCNLFEWFLTNKKPQRRISLNQK